MSQPRLPLTVISGYLGAGKTTLINRLLSEPHGQQLMVLVNDFGAINIDADLLVSAEKDTLLLSNGCVCCTIGGDLFMAVADALDRTPRPEHLIIEASGVAEPSKIANVALAEPDLRYAGIVTLADALNYRALAHDPLVGEQVKGQVRAADIVLLSKGSDQALLLELAVLADAPAMALSDDMSVSELLLELNPDKAPDIAAHTHPAYTSWSAQEPREFSRARLLEKLESRPSGLYRLKGRLLGPDGGLELHVVGAQISVSACEQPSIGKLVGIGPKQSLSQDAIAQWWA